MVKKKVTKKTPENSNENKNVHCNNKFKTLVTVILSLLLINILLSLVILTSQSSSISNDTNSKLDSINLKVNAIDNFFRTNVQGYDSGSNNNDVVGTKTTTNINISADDDPFLGNPKAKVTVIEFSDLQCPFCRKYWTESYPQLKKDFIDTNKIKYVFRDFPLGFHESAIPAAIAANCVREQLGDEGYFKFHNIAFTKQNEQGVNTIRFTNDDILSWVNLVGSVDMNKYNVCIKDPKQKAEIEADLAAGAKAGVSGTPSFFINGKLLVGAQPYSVLKAEIEKALNN